MDRGQLVKEDIEAGRNFLAAVDAMGDAVSAAFWLNDADNSVWKLMIARESSTINQLDDYMALRALLDKNPAINERLSLSDLRLLRPSDPLVIGLSRILPGVTPAKVQRWQGPVNGVPLDDVIIYRTAA